MKKFQTKMQKFVAAMVLMLLWLALPLTFTGCYIGKAEFKGEDMKMYPFFSTTATQAE